MSGPKAVYQGIDEVGGIYLWNPQIIDVQELSQEEIRSTDRLAEPSKSND